LKAVHAARLLDVRNLAPDVPDVLAGVIASCLARPSHLRPQSFADLADRLGPSTRFGRSRLAGVLWRPEQPWPAVRPANRRRQHRHRAAPWAMGVAATAALVVVALLPLWIRGRSEAVQTALTERAAPVAVAKHNASPAIHPARVDPAVKPAAAVAPVQPVTADVVLDVEGMLHVEQLDLKPHARVRGRGGKRPLVSVPRRGLVVACEDVTFENIDFTWEHEHDGRRPASNQTAAMILLEAQTATFRGCSFSTNSDAPPVAIAWSRAAQRLPGLEGEVSLGNCVFFGLAAVVDCRAKGGICVSLGNSLCVASGPLLRLHRAPAADEPIKLALDHVTMRGDSAVLECRYGRLDDNLGSITIGANDSAFAGNPRGGLLILAGTERPQPLMASLRWTGHGSIVTPQTALFVWRAAGRNQQSLAEEEVEVAGLVRSELEFAAAADGPPAASRVTDWQVPLRSTDPPGANTELLSLPRR
jgi:hypothetical protein